MHHELDLEEPGRSEAGWLRLTARQIACGRKGGAAELLGLKKQGHRPRPKGRQQGHDGLVVYSDRPLIGRPEVEQEAFAQR